MKNNRCLFIALMFSILLFLAQIVYLKYAKFSFVLFFAILSLPLVGIFIIYLFQILTNNKWKKFCYIASSIVLLVQIFGFYLLFSFHYISTHDNWYYKEYNNIAEYKTAKKELDCQKCIKHFPKEIPLNAKNIKFSQHKSYWWGSEDIFLKFETNKEYMENEIKKYSKNKINNYYPQQIFPFDVSDFEFYAIFYKIGRFLKEGGVGINNKNNTILYYYNNPDN